MLRIPLVLLCGLAILLAPRGLDAADKKAERSTVYPVAVFPFQERGEDVESLGGKATDLLFAALVVRPEMYLVEREELTRALDEQELSVAGLTDPEQSNRVGRLTGAKILITGSVLQVGDSLYVVAKLIGTETTRVFGASAKGKVTEELDAIVMQLAESVADRIREQGDLLVPQPLEHQDRLQQLARALGKGKRPSVWIEVPERHVGQTVPLDPAAETELARLCEELGFKVIDRKQGLKSDADVLLIGEGFSEFATRHGNLVSVKSRLELKAVDRETARLLA
ncbi:MAG: CsgG/HfaB family protein, partial [Planctomycetes bacterium]|nr:CsgG/HfaB family protein [Planctomycetota bacterium]